MKIFCGAIAAIALVLTPLSIFAGNLPSTQTYTIPLKEGVTLQMSVAPFRSREHRITRCEMFAETMPEHDSVVCLIDGKPVFGTDWEMPYNQLVKATLTVGGKTIDLDVSCMYNPFYDKPDSTRFSVEKADDLYIITGTFSDAAGSYDAQWLIIENGSVRTRLTSRLLKNSGFLVIL